MGISKIQILSHVVSFLAAILAVTMLTLAVFIGSDQDRVFWTKQTWNVHFEFITISSGLAVVLVAVSATPICVVMNQLVNRSI